MPKIRYERNAMISAAHLSSEDGGKAFVWCSIPGGSPFFQLGDGRTPAVCSSVVNGPECETHADFVRFVNERFGGSI